MFSKIYQKGQIVIPAMLRDKYRLDIGSSVEIIPGSDHIIIKKVESKGLMDLAGIVESDKSFPDKKIIKTTVQKALNKRNRLK